jgi:anti-sigma regulatory factor (Ser/Thr protein kinase)
MVKKEYQIIANNFELAGRASSDIKKSLKALDYSKALIKRICAASYESEINVVIHSVGGYMTFEIINDYIELNIYDDGPGIFDIALAMTEGYSTANRIANTNGFGAGMGLINMKRLSDVMEINSDQFGTHIRLIFFVGDTDELS